MAAGAGAVVQQAAVHRVQIAAVTQQLANVAILICCIIRSREGRREKKRDDE